jgi:hypothetical protein
VAEASKSDGRSRDESSIMPGPFAAVVSLRTIHESVGM